MKKAQTILVIACMAMTLLSGFVSASWAEGPQGNSTVAPSSGPSSPPRIPPEVIAAILAIMGVV